ncbi:outer membrane assembly protein AsmA [Enterobacteriaceae bacterium H18W14]|uniref:outer membrane assembly protein AsmA n=1 Tax=Dryocola boscaweniae TaxID=2925397 RepID=UPI0022F0805F|nr:outer membrane assembly protein AsmA [Dryocola boscaweniae]MCT4716397.1 outer membrane assembly protein AsmA [Dryocola boscaweniae]
MRRLLTALMILLAVLVAGLSALVLLVNPNDFRAYMVRQVEQRSGYQLTLDGPLRWHVWPQLSILSGRMSLTAPGASQPLVSSDNMRLDVALLPLLSHQLQVRQVMLKGAVIQLTPQSEERKPKDAPVGPVGNNPPVPENDPGWSFDIAKLKVADSVLVFQHADDEQITVRNINLQMEQDDKKQARVELSSRINRDQRDLNLSLVADLNASHFPQKLDAKISQLTYQLKGADLPKPGIMGGGTLQVSWGQAEKKLELNNLQLTANDSDLQGSASVVLDEKPQWAADLNANNLNLDKLALATPATNTTAAQRGQQQNTLPRPVIATGVEETTYRNLRGFSAQVSVAAKSVRWRGLEFTDVHSAISNDFGLLKITELAGKFGKGNMSLPGELDARDSEPQLRFHPKIEDIEIGPILTAFDYPIALSGEFSMQGEFSGDRLNAEAFRRSWQGEASVTMANSRLQGMNFQQLIQQAVERSNSDVKAQQNYENVTRLDSFSAAATLDNGQLDLKKMSGGSSLLTLTGEGTMDLVKEVCDTRFDVTVTGGWEGDSRLVALLKDTPIPLRVYGPWAELNYSLQVDQVLRKQLQDEAKRRLKEWADRNKDSSRSKDIKQLLDKL